MGIQWHMANHQGAKYPATVTALATIGLPLQERSQVRHMKLPSLEPSKTTHEIMRYTGHFKPLRFGTVCYAAVGD